MGADAILTTLINILGCEGPWDAGKRCVFKNIAWVNKVYYDDKKQR